jgi:fumarate hydratase class II
LLDVLLRLGALPLGGSAVGTGLNVPKGFAAAVVAKLASDMGLPLTEAVDHLAAQSSVDAFVECSGAARVAALALFKIAGDLRLLASGPHAGLAEVSLPELQKGSSIMPGKVNPVIPEAVQQVACQIVGNDAAIAFASTLSTLQLNTAMPVIARNLLESLRLLAAAATVLAEKCIDGLSANVETMRRYAESSPAVITALNPLIGYDRAAEIVKHAAASGRSVRDVALEESGLPAEEVDEALDPLRLATGRRSRRRS